MDKSWKGVIYILGIIAALYLFIRYVVPFLFTFLGIVLKAVMWIAVVLIVMILIAYIIKMITKK